jgi:Bifunctional DNA primase/polymerase, N-terminal
MIISPGVSDLSMAEAFRYYRDELGWQVYPVDGPWAKKDPGKKPSVSQFWNYDPHGCDGTKWFNGSSCHNIGFAPRDKVVVVDLDSKPDQGKSVEQFLAERGELTGTPWHRTRGGIHLVYRCRDLPQWKHSNGRPYHERLTNKLSENVSAELFHSDHSNVVLPPSVHAVDGSVYRWGNFGEFLEVSWQWLQENYGFTGAQQPGKELPWWLKFDGDLHWLNLRGMLEAIGYPGRLIGEGKRAVFCPWRAEHSTEIEETIPSGSTIVWQHTDGSAWPGFKCLHAHCAERGLRELLEWAESQEKGIVDRFCSQSRVWRPGQLDEKGRPRILHPSASGRLDSEVHIELGRIIGAKHGWFVRGKEIVVIDKVPSGFAYSGDPEIKFSVESNTVGLSELSPVEARSDLERYVVPGRLVQKQFVRKSFSTDFCTSLVRSGQLADELPRIARILTVPLPFRPRGSKRLIYPSKGYDPRFLTYLVDDAPEIDETFPVNRALEVIKWMHREFCFTNEQSRVHAIARLLTPFARGILGWTTRVPLWHFCANRPRAGKDYLSGVTLTLYEGMAFEDAPIGRESEETIKRIVSAARSGRRFMHFSNCQYFLHDQYLTQAITNRVIGARSLGANTGKSDLVLSNEMEYSISSQVGLTFSEDIEPRIRQIELAFSEEDPNKRVFQSTRLHEEIKKRRSEVLSAVAALYRNWGEKGFRKGPTPFTSYPEWAETIGGVMVAAGLGDPCLPFEGEYNNVGGDLRTEAMTELFRVCRQQLPRDAWVLKKQIYECVHQMAQPAGDSDGNDALSYFGSLKEPHSDARSNQTKLGVALRTFKNRELGGIKLLIDESAAKSQQYKYRFVRVSGEDTPPETREAAAVVDKDEQRQREIWWKWAEGKTQDEVREMLAQQTMKMHKQILEEIVRAREASE